MGRAYRSLDLLVDIGPCMRRRLAVQGGAPRRETLVPWALAEPKRLPGADPTVRSALFGKAKLGLLYSGNMGRAHRYELFLDLARACRTAGVEAAFCFACRGYRASQLRGAVTGDDTNIRLVPFVPGEGLERHLGAADLHLISLKPEWSGIVVPSKFFGSLAVGRPLLYDGPEESAIAAWIRELRVGMVLRQERLGETVAWLDRMSSDREEMERWQQRVFSTYREHFNRDRVLDAWDRLLREQLAKGSETDPRLEPASPGPLGQSPPLRGDSRPRSSRRSTEERMEEM
jgi:hypothetical protein